MNHVDNNVIKGHLPFFRRCFEPTSDSLKRCFKANDARDFLTGKGDFFILSCKTSFISELFISLKAKWSNPKLRLTVARSCATVSNFPGIRACFGPLQGIKITLAPTNFFWYLHIFFKMYRFRFPFTIFSVFIGKMIMLTATIQSLEI